MDYRVRKQHRGYCIYGGCWTPRANANHCEPHRQYANTITRRVYELANHI